MKKSDIQAIGTAVANVLNDFRRDIVKEFEQRMVYRGVYDSETEYSKGNFVTCDGSLWHAQQDGFLSKPGGSDEHFKLAVKRGKPGRDAVGDNEQ